MTTIMPEAHELARLIRKYKRQSETFHTLSDKGYSEPFLIAQMFVVQAAEQEAAAYLRTFFGPCPHLCNGGNPDCECIAQLMKDTAELLKEGVVDETSDTSQTQ